MKKRLQFLSDTLKYLISYVNIKEELKIILS